MGDPVGDDVEPGDACSICWGEGKEFGSGDTPKYITITVSDIAEPYEMLNGSFSLEQLEDGPCRYHLDNGTGIYDLNFGSSATSVGVHYQTYEYYIAGCSGGICDQEFESGSMKCLVDPSGTPNPYYKLATVYNLINLENLRCEKLNVTDNQKNITLASFEIPTNILIKFNIIP